MREQIVSSSGQNLLAAVSDMVQWAHPENELRRTSARNSEATLGSFADFEVKMILLRPEAVSVSAIACARDLLIKLNERAFCPGNQDHLQVGIEGIKSATTESE